MVEVAVAVAVVVAVVVVVAVAVAVAVAVVVAVEVVVAVVVVVAVAVAATQMRKGPDLAGRGLFELPSWELLHRRYFASASARSISFLNFGNGCAPLMK